MYDPDAQLKKLERVLELLDDSGYVKTGEFVQLFEALITVLRKNLDSTETFLEKNLNRSTTSLSQMEQRLKDAEAGIEKHKKELLTRIENIELTPGDPGKDADEEAIFARLLSAVPPCPEVTEETPEETVDKVNKSKSKIKKSQIEGLEELERMVKMNAENTVTKPKDFDIRIGVSQTDLARLQAQITEIANSITTGGTWIHDDVAGTIDGSNTIFTLSQAPVSPNSLILSLARQIQVQDVDFTLSGSTITYTTAPDASLSAEPHVAQFQ